MIIRTTGDRDTLDKLELRRAALGDGGKDVRRFEKQRYPKLGDATAHEFHIIITDVVELLLIKARHAHQTEAEIKDFLRSKKSSYQRAGKPRLAAMLPTTYKAMLTLLQDSGECCTYAQTCS